MARLRITYEWDIETFDPVTEDIDDHWFGDTVLEVGLPQGPGERLVLVQDVGNQVEGIVGRAWAYVEDGKLPEYFLDAGECEIAKVPQRFHVELAKALNLN